MKKFILTLFIGLLAVNSFAKNKVTINADLAKIQISKHIYGHFAEHIGGVIYDGIYVGENNKDIPNTASAGSTMLPDFLINSRLSNFFEAVVL